MLLLSTSSLAGYGLHRIFSIVKEAKYDGINLCIENDLLDTWDGEYIQSLSLEFWIPVLSISAPVSKLNETKVENIIEIAKLLWSRVITFSPPHISDKNTKWFKVQLPKIKKVNDTFLSIKNVPPKFLFFVIPEYKGSTLDQIKRITGYTTLDVAWIDAWSGIDIIKAETLLIWTLKNIFISDKSATKEWLLPGQAGSWVSHLPLESFFMQLKVANYKEDISLSVNPEELWVGDEWIVQEKLLLFKKYYTKYFKDFQP